MLLYDTLKFACQRCQSGHRSAVCVHLDRRVDEIKAKGRPVSQCGHCRAKRQRGVGHSHHRCLCGDRPPKSLRAKVERWWILYLQTISTEYIGLLWSCIDPMRSGKMVSNKEPFNITVIKKIRPVKSSASHRPSIKTTTSGPSSCSSKLGMDSLTTSLSSDRINTGSDSAATVLESSTTGVTAKESAKTEEATVVSMEPVSLQVFEVQVDDEIFSALNSPCKCHFGGVCICADLPQDKDEKPALENIAEVLLNGRASMVGSSILNSKSPLEQKLDTVQEMPLKTSAGFKFEKSKNQTIAASSVLTTGSNPNTSSYYQDRSTVTLASTQQPFHIINTSLPLSHSLPNRELPYSSTQHVPPPGTMNSSNLLTRPHFLTNEQYQQFLQFQQFQQFQDYRLRMGLASGSDSRPAYPLNYDISPSNHHKPELVHSERSGPANLYPSAPNSMPFYHQRILYPQQSHQPQQSHSALFNSQGYHDAALSGVTSRSTHTLTHPTTTDHIMKAIYLNQPIHSQLESTSASLSIPARSEGDVVPAKSSMLQQLLPPQERELLSALVSLQFGTPQISESTQSPPMNLQVRPLQQPEHRNTSTTSHAPLTNVTSASQSLFNSAAAINPLNSSSNHSVLQAVPPQKSTSTTRSSCCNSDKSNPVPTSIAASSSITKSSCCSGPAKPNLENQRILDVTSLVDSRSTTPQFLPDLNSAPSKCQCSTGNGGCCSSGKCGCGCSDQSRLTESNSKDDDPTQCMCDHLDAEHDCDDQIYADDEEYDPSLID
ncbi:hypothetical protein BDEG_20863 [Batrachochytrium dendrobatidis JEL423]|uniref:Copper-fist domain-containing protein n=1 Tax=Batrachochytrium dendrobatidis (strain JEL423) TaxID=403673 RepID=A0A177W9G7_BATDL|nr:hypothetical protein BDEG_20863 [Batrachochytrium dendrobatidis JEL423]